MGWTMRRGEVYLANLGNVKHTDIGKIRPVVIFQNDRLNRMVEEGLYDYVIVLPLSSQIKRHDYAYDLPKRERLEKESIVLCHSVKMIAAKRLYLERGCLMRLHDDEIKEIESKVASAMGMK